MMNDQMHPGMAEATRLTQQGRLDEATAAIQRALGGAFAPAAKEDIRDTDEPIEVISRLVSETPQEPAEADVRSSAGLARLRGRPLGRPCAPAACNSLGMRAGKLASVRPEEDTSSSVRTPTARAPAPTSSTSRAATPARLFP